MPHTQIKLIRDYFFQGEPSATVISETKALSEQDKIELASAIAREMGVTNDCAFALVEY